MFIVFDLGVVTTGEWEQDTETHGCKLRESKNNQTSYCQISSVSSLISLFNLSCYLTIASVRYDPDLFVTTLLSLCHLSASLWDWIAILFSSHYSLTESPIINIQQFRGLKQSHVWTNRSLLYSIYSLYQHTMILFWLWPFLGYFICLSPFKNNVI